MAYNEELADRVRIALSKKKTLFDQRKMMGGLCILVDGKMCVGIIKDSLMARIDPEIYAEALVKKGCTEMDFTGRPMKGFVYIHPEGITTESELGYWLQLCLDFNPRAKASKKKSRPRLKI